jgi:hypothetical protein
VTDREGEKGSEAARDGTEIARSEEKRAEERSRAGTSDGARNHPTRSPEPTNLRCYGVSD